MIDVFRPSTVVDYARDAVRAETARNEIVIADLRAQVAELSELLSETNARAREMMGLAKLAHQASVDVVQQVRSLRGRQP